MRMSDWSSDVCSSDLLGPEEWLLMAPTGQENDVSRRFDALYAQAPHSLVDIGHRETGIDIEGPAATLALAAACPPDLASIDRKSVVKGKCVPVRVDLGGHRPLKKKKNNTQPNK